MIANFFSKTKPIHAIFISVLFFVYYLLFTFLVEKPMFSWGIVLEKFGLLVVFLVLFFLVRFINRKNNLSGQNSYVLLLLALLLGLFPHAMEMNSIFIAHFCMLLCFRRAYSIKTNKDIKEKIFDCGFWIGLASLFYMWSAIFILLIYAVVILHKRQEIRNLIIPIVGFITPIFIAFTYYFLTDNLLAFSDIFLFEYSLVFDSVSFPILLVIVLSIGGIIIVSQRINTITYDLKPSWFLLIIHFIIACCILVFAPQENTSKMIFMFFPSIIIIANYLQLLEGKVFKEIVVMGLMALSLSVYFL